MESTTCAFCGRLSHMTRVMEPLFFPPRIYNGPKLAQCAFRCDNCNFMSIGYGTATSDRRGGSAISWERWEPKEGVGRDFPDVPDHIAQAASEAHQCRSINADRAAIMLARAVIEATAKECGITTGLLYEKIEALAEADVIRKKVASAAHEVRHLGNDMAHGDFATPPTGEEADEVLNIMATVLAEAFQEDARTERLKQARESKRESPPA